MSNKPDRNKLHRFSEELENQIFLSLLKHKPILTGKVFTRSTLRLKNQQLNFDELL